MLIEHIHVTDQKDKRQLVFSGRCPQLLQPPKEKVWSFLAPGGGWDRFKTSTASSVQSKYPHCAADVTEYRNKPLVSVVTSLIFNIGHHGTDSITSCQMTRLGAPHPLSALSIAFLSSCLSPFVPVAGHCWLFIFGSLCLLLVQFDSYTLWQAPLFCLMPIKLSLSLSSAGVWSRQTRGMENAEGWTGGWMRRRRVRGGDRDDPEATGKSSGVRWRLVNTAVITTLVSF